MIIDDLELRALNFAGVKTLVNWAEEEGWNPGPNDAEVYWAADPEGFIGYFYQNQLIAGGAIISYNQEFGFMGLFIVKPQFRAQGIGRKLWLNRRDLLLGRLNENCSIGLDGVLAMQSFYNKGGFDIAFKDKRYERVGSAFTTSSKISPVAIEDLPAVLALDKECFGFNRPQFLIPWLKLPGNYTFKFKEGNQLQGFTVVRKAAKGYKIGPLFANSPTVAEELYKACLNAVIGQPLYIDIPASNKSAAAIVEKYQAEYVFECARMYLGPPPPAAMHKVYGITSFELG